MTDPGWGSRPMAFVPSQRVASPSDGAVLEMRATVDGRLAVLAFGTLAALVEGCGDRQPWISVPADALPELARRSGADGILWDAVLEPDQRYPSGADHG